jgi:2-alkenal reductase
MIGAGCLFLIILVIVAGIAIAAVPFWFFNNSTPTTNAPRRSTERAQGARPAPTFTPALQSAQSAPPPQAPASAEGDEQALTTTTNLLRGRYSQLNPGVVNIQVFVNRATGQGAGAGSGFVLDQDGYIVTNYHVVDGATLVIIVFFNGLEAEAEIVGTDDDSDLAVLRVDALPEGVHPLPLADSDQVQVGDWAIAIGNPFGLGSSMTLGIVSAVGRSIPSGVAQFSIPQAIQTDAAINPGNSGGPLLNLDGNVVGVNAQIRTGGANANTGVGFAIASNVVRHIAPTLIATGTYQWPWLGIEGTDVNLPIMQANNLDTQQGAYIVGVVEDGPAARAGLRGSTRVTTVAGIEVPTGGDVVIEVDGQPIASFNDLLIAVAYKTPGDEINLTVLRDGQREQVVVTLEARPDFVDAETP